jgi:hypothetical protein
MTETVVLLIALLIAALVMASGVWVAAVLVRTVVRVKHPAPAAKSGTVGQADS